jgi:hypothetical protein
VNNFYVGTFVHECDETVSELLQFRDKPMFSSLVEMMSGAAFEAVKKAALRVIRGVQPAPQ